MSDSILYVYGIAPAGIRVATAPPGLDNAALSIIESGDIAALVSNLDAELYSREQIEASVADVAWVGPRAVAHDAMVTWASEQGGVIPLPAFTIFSDESAVQTMLRERGAQLVRTLAHVARGHEYAVRLFRIDELLARQLAELSPRIAEIESEARSATPGQRYLLERKADAERKGELRQIASNVASAAYAALAERSLAATREELPKTELDGAIGIAVLNAYFLVGRSDLEPFREELTRLAKRHEPMGFRFEFTGPWPPYHFVRES